MNRISARTAVAALGVPLVIAAVAAAWIGWGPTRGAAHAATQLTRGERTRLANLAVPFIPNRGQLGSQVAFYAPTFAGTVFVTHTGALVLSLPAPSGSASATGWTLVESPVTNRTLRARGVQPTLTHINIFQGRDAQRGLQTYAQVSLGEVWPGIDYDVRAHGAHIERLFTVQPGANVGAIRMRVRGAHTLRVEHGRLVAVTGNGPVTLSRPRAWQRLAGKRHAVLVHFVVAANRYGFRLGAYNRQVPVVIDPLIRTTYLGGANGTSAANAMRMLAANGKVYLAGTTTSASFPGTAGGAQSALAGASDAFVAELSPDLSQLIQASYLGGSGDDTATALAIASVGTPNAGDVYLAGTTHSSNFPGTTGGGQAQCGGGTSLCRSDGDGFVAMFTPDLKTLIQASYLGGSNMDEVHALAIASSSAPSPGAVYIAGRTLSQDFPNVAGGAQPQSASAVDYEAFVTRFNPGLTTIVQSTYLGGSAVDEAYALAISPTPSGTVYVAGDTSSTDFPCVSAGGPPPAGGACGTGTTSGAQPQLAGGFDAFVAVLNPTLTRLQQATYLGGSDIDSADVIAVAPSGSSQAGQVFVGGYTYSINFPGVANDAQNTLGGGSDGFIARLSSGLHSLGGATYLGGSGADVVQAFAFSGSSSLYAAGKTASSDFPCTSPTGPVPAGGGSCTQQHAGAQFLFGGGPSDGFVALFNANLAALVQASYVGGKAADSVSGVSLAPPAGTFTGDVFVGGSTSSPNLPGTVGAAQPAYTGLGDAFAAALTPALEGPEVTLNLVVNGPASITTKKEFKTTIVVTNASPVGNDASNVVVSDVLNAFGSTATIDYVSTTATQGSCNQIGGVVVCSLGLLSANGGSAQITITAKAGGTGGAVTSDITTHSGQALDPASIDNISQKITITKASASGGGGAFGWLLLLLLAVFTMGVTTLRHRKHRQPPG